MQINRLFEMVYLLLDRRIMTAKELSEQFEVSTRTIYRDVEILSSAGIPIFMNKGRGGGISLMDHFVLNKSVLSDQEQGEILSALHGLSAFHVEEVDPVLKKLATVFNKNSISWITVDFSAWGSDDQEREKFEHLKSAILSARIITFEYANFYGKKSKRIVEPLQIWFKEKAWYLKAFCLEKQDFRTFKIMRMRGIKLEDETFSRRNLEAYPIESQPQNTTIVKLKLASSISHRVQYEFSEQNIHLNEDGSFTATIDFPEDEWVYGYIMSFGSCCEVLEPPHIRELIYKRLQEGLENYE